MKRDPLGQALQPRLDAIEAPDDRTLVFRLNQPFPRLLTMIGKLTAAGIMPERLATTDAYTAVTEIVGSGPFRFLKDEYVSGSRAAFARAEMYAPRTDQPDYCAGAKRAMVDRVEWQIIPDSATAASALLAGEVDWVDMPLPDLLPLLRRNPDVMVGRLDPIGLFPQCRPNMLQGPTANVGVRQAILAAVDQREVMQAVMGDDSSAYRTGVGVFVPKSPDHPDPGLGHAGAQARRRGEGDAGPRRATTAARSCCCTPRTSRSTAPCATWSARRSRAAASPWTTSRWTGAPWCSAGPARHR